MEWKLFVGSVGVAIVLVTILAKMVGLLECAIQGCHKFTWPRRFKCLCGYAPLGLCADCHTKATLNGVVCPDEHHKWRSHELRQEPVFIK